MIHYNTLAPVDSEVRLHRSARDRNRIAQRRYRDRQKTKLQESEGRVAELTESLRVLTSEKVGRC